MQQRVDRLRGRLLDLFGEAEVRLRERRVELRVHERLLERVAVVEHFELRLLDARGEPRGDVRRDHDRGEHLARLDLRDRLRARGDVHRLHLAEQLLGVLRRPRRAGCRPGRSRPGGVSSTIATRGRAGLREIARPISSAIATG